MNSQELYHLILKEEHEAVKTAIHAILEKRVAEMKEEYRIELGKDILQEEEESLDEAVAKRKIVVRNNRRVVKYKCPPGYKKTPGKRTCKRVSASQRIKRSRVAKKAARKRRAKRTQMQRKRTRSMKKRKGLGIKK